MNETQNEAENEGSNSNSWSLTFPPRVWLKNYRWKRDFIYDAIAGISLSSIIIPQSMAYATMAGLQPVIGLYSSMIPSLLYFMLGTSLHMSFGPFALTSLMLQNAISKLNLSDAGDRESASLFMSLCVGVIQMILWCFGGARIASWVSPETISGFTTAAAIQIVTTQFAPLLGLKAPASDSSNDLFFSVFKEYAFLLGNLGNISIMSTVVGTFCVAFLFLFRYLNKRFAEKLVAPVPEVVLIVVITTLLCKFVPAFGENLSVLGYIPSGFPSFAVPRLNPALINLSFAIDCLELSLVTFIISVSVAGSFAHKLGYYRINPNQELFVYGLCNFLSSFFSCYLSCASLSRSSLLVNLNAKTPIAPLISVFAVASTLLWIAKFFEDLPKTCLAAIVIVALWGVFSQIFDLKKLAREKGRIKLSEWLISFVAVLCLDVSWGLIVSILYCKLVLPLVTFTRLLRSPVFLMGKRGPNFVRIWPWHASNPIPILSRLMPKSPKQYPGIKIIFLKSQLQEDKLDLSIDDALKVALGYPMISVIGDVIMVLPLDRTSKIEELPDCLSSRPILYFVSYKDHIVHENLMRTDSAAANSSNKNANLEDEEKRLIVPSSSSSPKKMLDPSASPTLSPVSSEPSPPPLEATKTKIIWSSSIESAIAKIQRSNSQSTERDGAQLSPMTVT